MEKVCVVMASGKLGQYMVRHTLNRSVYSWKLKALVKVFGWLARLVRFADLDDQVEVCRCVFASQTRWTVVRGSDLEGGRARGCRCGAGMWATLFWRAT